MSDNIYDEGTITNEILDTIRKISELENIPADIVHRVFWRQFDLYLKHISEIELGIIRKGNNKESIFDEGFQAGWEAAIKMVRYKLDDMEE